MHYGTITVVIRCGFSPNSARYSTRVVFVRNRNCISDFRGVQIDILAVFRLWSTNFSTTDVIVPQCTNGNRIRNWHICKIRFLFLVSSTIEYKVAIAEFYLYMEFSADLLKNVVTRA